MSILSFDPMEKPHRERHQILLSGVAPRPIALVATLDTEGNVNLAPFSFFNAYSSKPPIVAIGPAFSAATGKVKDTYLNISTTSEATISVVTDAMAEQINIASFEYPHGTDEFVKSGLTKHASDVVTPPWVQESPFAMECKFLQNIPLGREMEGNGNLMLLQAVRFHVNESVLDGEGKIDPHKMRQISRMGYDWYSAVLPDTIFEMKKPTSAPIGVDALPKNFRSFFSPRELALLAVVPELPAYAPNPEELAIGAARAALAIGDAIGAWAALA